MATAMRFISLILIAIGLMLLGADVITSLEKGHVTVRSLDQVWSDITAQGLLEFKAWLDHHLSVGLANGVKSFLNVYSWAPFGVVGVILAFLVGRGHEDEA
ncbi:MAG: hypothetical protein WBQ17_10710 [Rhizomicrobium sp.]|jgi:hypothetical protein